MSFLDLSSDQGFSSDQDSPERIADIMPLAELRMLGFFIRMGEYVHTFTRSEERLYQRRLVRRFERQWGKYRIWIVVRPSDLGREVYQICRARWLAKAKERK